MRALSIAVCVMLLFGMPAAQNVGYQQDPQWHPPADATARANPLAAKLELASGGEKLFKRHCVECHGEDGTGLVRKNAADLRLPVVQSQTDGTLFWRITNGNTSRGMPSFSRLPELQRWQLVLYLRSLKPMSAPPAQESRK